MGILHSSGQAEKRVVDNGGCMKNETNKKSQEKTKDCCDATPSQQHQQQQQQAHRRAAKVISHARHTLRRGGFSRAPPRSKYTSGAPADGAILDAERFLVQATCAQHATGE